MFFCPAITSSTFSYSSFSFALMPLWRETAFSACQSTVTQKTLIFAWCNHSLHCIVHLNKNSITQTHVKSDVIRFTKCVSQAVTNWPFQCNYQETSSYKHLFFVVSQRALTLKSITEFQKWRTAFRKVHWAFFILFLISYAIHCVTTYGVTGCVKTNWIGVRPSPTPKEIAV